MCFSTPKPKRPDPIPPPPPAPEEPPAAPALADPAGASRVNEDASARARRLGTSQLRIDLNVPGRGVGPNVP